jgi:hypothetical protein
MRTLSALLIPAISAVLAAAQTDNTISVKKFPGATVGDKIVAAQQTCDPNAAIPCILVLDPSLAVVPAGTFPGLCPQCSIEDFRGGGQPFMSQALSSLESFSALPSSGAADPVTNRLRNFIRSTSAGDQTRARGVVWIGPQAPANALDSQSHPIPYTSELNSSQRIFDTRGTNCMDWLGYFSFNDNSFCFEGSETVQDPNGSGPNGSTAGMWRNLVHIGYNSLNGGVYNYTGPHSGTKSNRHALWVNGEYHTAAQNGLIGGDMNCLTGGECMGFNLQQIYPGGYIGPGQEAMEGIRIQQQQTFGSPDGSGGYWSATDAQVNSSAGTVSFTPGANANTLAEARPIRDLESAYSTGTYSGVACSGVNPATCTISGSDTNWTRIQGFVGAHTTMFSAGGPIAKSNLLFCAMPGAQGGFDACVPIASGLDDTHLTVNLLAVGSQQNTAWPWPTSGKYAIYTSAWPTQVDIGAHSFSAADLSGIGNGHKLDQVIAYNSDQWGIQIVQSRNIGRSYGGGINLVDYGPADSPPYGCGYCASGHYSSAFGVGVSNPGSGTPAIVLEMFNPGTLGTIVDYSGGSGFQHAWLYYDSNRTLQTPLGYTRNASSGIAGLAFFVSKAYITTNGAGEFLHLGNANHGSDISGTIAIREAASGSFNFGTAYSEAPKCVASPTSNPGTVSWWVTATERAVTVNLSSAATISFNYICSGT